MGQRIGFSGTMVGKIETGERAPSQDIAGRCDEALGTTGLLVRIYDLARRWEGGYPSWFAGWKDRERTATSLCWWEPLLIPGLVQTAGYARALFEGWRMAEGEELEEMVATRTERQSILGRADPPSLWAIIDETVLHRRIGDATIMNDQLGHLAALAEHPGVTVQVVPADTGAHAGLLGAFIIAAGNGADTVYLESPDQGQTTELPSVVAKLTQTFNILRAVALSPQASRELITKAAAERWT